jgi:ribonuclease P protein component
MLQTYPSLLRLLSSADFQAVWKTGKRTSVPLLTLVSCENKLAHPRLGISIPKKNIRSSVHRNRLKRLARETFRVRQSILGNRDIVVLAYKGAEALSPEEQYERFNRLWDLLIQRETT